MFIKNNSAWINIDLACEYLELSRSAYYSWLDNYDKNLVRAQEYKALTEKVIKVFTESKNRYGSRKIADKLAKNSIGCNRKKVAVIMHENNLIPCGYKKLKVTTTNSNHKYKVFDNLLNRNFKVDKPNQVYVGDITYIRTNEGWVYLATVIDLFSRKLVGYKTSNRMTADLVVSALHNALKSRGYPKGVIVHSDRGSQYASNQYKRFLKDNSLVGSMSKKGDCWDNAVAESFFATLKKEYVYQTVFKTRVQAQLGVFDYIETWYNKIRAHSTLDGLSPMEFEAEFQYKFVDSKSKIKHNNIQNIRALNV
jgi:putative transposase